MGREEPGRLSRDRANYDVVRVYVSKAAFVGKPLRDIPLPDFPVMISHVRRGDIGTDCLVRPDARVRRSPRGQQFPTGGKPKCRRHFGDSIKGNAEMSFVSIGVGMALGLLLGMIPFPLPGGGTFSLGVAGGPLVMALVLGWLGRTGPDRLEDAGGREPGPAESRPVGVHRVGRDRRRSAVRPDRGIEWNPDPSRRGGRAAHFGADRARSAAICCASRSTTCSASVPARPAIPRSSPRQDVWRRPSGPTSAMRSASRA